MMVEVHPRPRRIVEGRVLNLVWPDGHRVVLDYLGRLTLRPSYADAPGRLGRLIRVFGVEIEDTGLRRKWDADHAVPVSDPYKPPPKEEEKR